MLRRYDQFVRIHKQGYGMSYGKELTREFNASASESKMGNGGRSAVMGKRS